ncbi:MAG: ABC transporter substrate-binding protein [Candidatus Cryptobacteroides sp.]
MKNNPFILFILTAFLSAGCAGGASTLADFDVPVYLPEHAGGFSILGAEGRESTIIRVSNPWQGAEGVEGSLLVRRGSEEVPEGYEGEVLDGDASRIVCMSSTHVAMLEAVGAAGTVVGVSGLRYICNETVRNGGTVDIGYDESIDYEILVALEPDLVLLYGVNGSSPAQKKLDELGIPYLYIGEYVEQNPLGKAEWMVAVAETVGRRDVAQEAFRGIVSRYDDLKSRIAEAVKDRPEVMFNTPYADTWFMPTTRSYMIRLVEDAGGDYIFKENQGGGSVPLDMEKALLLVSRADVWLNVQAESTEALCRRYPRFRGLPCVVSGRLYNCDRRMSDGGGNDFWETGVVEPDIVLRELAGILHPELSDECEYVYFRRL